jgi:hypothetical protein
MSRFRKGTEAVPYRMNRIDYPFCLSRPISFACGSLDRKSPSAVPDRVVVAVPPDVDFHVPFVSFPMGRMWL